MYCSARRILAKTPQPADDEIKKFYDQHKEQFRLPPTIVLNYVQTKDKALADTLSKELFPALILPLSPKN